MLFEALIAMVLFALIGVGTAYVASRMAVSQKNMNVQNSAVSQLRNLLLTQGNALCGSTPSITVAGTALDVRVNCTARTSVQVAGTTLTSTASSISLSVNSDALFGGSGTIIVGE